jgi:hypothetical protein
MLPRLSGSGSPGRVKKQQSPGHLAQRKRPAYPNGDLKQEFLKLKVKPSSGLMTIINPELGFAFKLFRKEACLVVWPCS